MSSALRVLLVEDSPTDAKLILQQIRRAGHAITFNRVEDRPTMLLALEEKIWDVIICDWSLPHFSALAALETMREKGLDVPFIIVSGTVGEELAVEAMRSGAQDYLLKGNLARLAPVIERELREHELREAHRRNRKALRQSEARFARLDQSGMIGIVTGKLTGEIVEANDAFLEMIGFSREDLVEGKISWKELTAPESLEATKRGWEQLHSQGMCVPYEKDYIRKDGTRVSVLTGQALLNDQQSIGFMVDLRAQKRAEAALRKSEEQLRQAQKMEAVGRLAGGVAHDFNNLLSVILSYTAMIIGDLREGDPMRDDVVEIERAGERAAALTRQLLMFSRQEVIEPRVLDLNELLVNMTKLMQRLLGEDVDLVFLGQGALGRIRADPSHIEQVIMNLVVNSRDAMPTGGKLTIETKNVELNEIHAREHLGVSPGSYVMLCVTDTGMGIDQETQAHIFEPFFTTKEKSKGTGLGLSTVFGIVQQCRGSIWVYSELGHGTTFKVYLPRIDAAVDVLAAVIPPADLHGTETILLVEDEDQIRMLARNVLRKHGYQVLEARNAGEGLLQCEGHAGTIHLLLTDVVMPQMSGPELAKRLVRDRPGIKVLYMSGYTDDALIRHGALGSGIAYLQKPITPDKLMTKVRSVLDAK